MDVQQHFVTFYIVILISIFTIGLCAGHDINLSDLMSDEQIMEGELTPRDRRVPYSTFDPELDWSRQETDRDADKTLVNFVRGNLFPNLDSASGRFPRINRRKIIPFYQYGNEFRGYRSNPRFTAPARFSYFVSPWKSRGYNLGNRMVRTYVGTNK